MELLQWKLIIQPTLYLIESQQIPWLPPTIKSLAQITAVILSCILVKISSFTISVRKYVSIHRRNQSKCNVSINHDIFIIFAEYVSIFTRDRLITFLNNQSISKANLVLTQYNLDNSNTTLLPVNQISCPLFW